MVRAFARKSEHDRRHLSGRDEHEWLETSSSNEVSPASLWGLDNERGLGISEDEQNRSGNEAQPVPVSVASSDEPPPTESSPPDQEWAAYDAEPDWWAQPNLMDQAYTPGESEPSEPTIEPPEIPFVAEEYYPPGKEQEPDDDEDTLILQPLAETTIQGTVTAALSEVPEEFREELPSPSKISNENPHPRVLVLDENTVLPSEASFATVPLAKEKKRPRLLDESTVLPSEASYATVMLNQENKSRPRVLDETTVLPHEASFATVPLYRYTPRSYSPSREFVTKVTFGLQRALPVVLLVAVCAAVIVFSLKYKSIGIFNDAEEQTPRTPAVDAAFKSARSEQATAPAKQLPVSTATEATTPVQTVDPTAAAKLAITAPKIEKPTVNPTKRIAEEKTEKRQVSEKLPVTKPKAEAKKTASDTAKRTENQPEEAAPATEQKPKSTDETPPVTAGGGERPRRVSPPGDSQPKGTPAPKPKVIDWP